MTGGNRGIGFETCRQLARNGFQVILTARDSEKGAAAADTLVSEGLDVQFFECDVTQSNSIKNLPSFVESRFGRLDALINNAGVLPDNKVPGNFEETSILDTHMGLFRQAMDTNAFAVIQLCQSLIPIMEKNAYGRIVNVSSLVAQLSSMAASVPAYRVSKVALNAITVILADELKGTGILCNCVSPGWVKTDMGGVAATRSVEEGTRDIVMLATLPDDGPTGQFFREGKSIAW